MRILGKDINANGVDACYIQQEDGSRNYLQSAIANKMAMIAMNYLPSSGEDFLCGCLDTIEEWYSGNDIDPFLLESITNRDLHEVIYKIMNHPHRTDSVCTVMYLYLKEVKGFTGLSDWYTVLNTCLDPDFVWQNYTKQWFKGTWSKLYDLLTDEAIGFEEPLAEKIDSRQGMESLIEELLSSKDRMVEYMFWEYPHSFHATLKKHGFKPFTSTRELVERGKRHHCCLRDYVYAASEDTGGEVRRLFYNDFYNVEVSFMEYDGDDVVYKDGSCKKSTVWIEQCKGSYNKDYSSRVDQSLLEDLSKLDYSDICVVSSEPDMDYDLFLSRLEQS